MLKSYENWKQKRFISQEETLNKKGFLLDVQKTNGKWVKAMILEHYLDEQQSL